jgi:threonine/homoserine/homoserine lactone efflux protein
MFDDQFCAFLILAALLTVTPGADTVLTFRNSLAKGTRAGLWTAAGVCSGFFVQPVLASLGVAALFVESQTAFNVVKFAGAGYLIYLGAQSLRSSWQWLHAGATLDNADAQGLTSGDRSWANYRQGLLTNALNPKIAVFYFAVLPQFVAPGQAVLLKSLVMSASHYLMGVIWLSAVACAAGRARAAFMRPRVRAAFDGIAGLAMIGFGLKLAASKAR